MNKNQAALISIVLWLYEQNIPFTHIKKYLEDITDNILSIAEIKEIVDSHE